MIPKIPVRPLSDDTYKDLLDKYPYAVDMRGNDKLGIDQWVNDYMGQKVCVRLGQLYLFKTEKDKAYFILKWK